MSVTTNLSIRDALKLAETTTNDAIAYQQGKREASPIPTKQTQFLAGFEIPALSAAQDATNPKAQAIMAQLKEGAKDATALKALLTKHDLQPLAVLPSTIWNSMSKAAGLYQLTPQGNQVWFDANEVLKPVSERVNAAVRAIENSRFAIYLGVSASLWLCIVGYSAYYAGFEAALIRAIATFFFWLFFSDSFNVSQKKRQMMNSHEVVALVEAHRQAGTLPAKLWPDQVAPTEGTAVRITLPPAPAEVQEVLRKAAKLGLPLQVAAVPEAIGFQDDLVALLTKERAKQAEAERQAAEAARRDPIIFVQHGTATAILAQFGDFEVEEQLIEDAIRDGLFADA